VVWFLAKLSGVVLGASGVAVSYFELWGYPGAGKSTIAHGLAKRRSIVVPESPSFARSFARHPIRSALVLARNGVLMNRALWESGHSDQRITIAAAAARQACLAADHDSPFLLEEGVVHEVWRALYREPALIRERWWRRVLRRNTAHLVVLEVSPARAQAGIRVKTFGLGPANLELKDAPLDGECWRRARAAFDAIDDQLQASARSMVRFDNETATPAEAIDALDEVISAVRRWRPHRRTVVRRGTRLVPAS
jgi:hypothetical protein